MTRLINLYYQQTLPRPGFKAELNSVLKFLEKAMDRDEKSKFFLLWMYLQKAIRGSRYETLGEKF